MFFPARRSCDELRLAKLAEMGGNARLPHPEHLLDLHHSELFLAEKQEQTQSRFIGQKAEIFSRLTPCRMSADISAHHDSSIYSASESSRPTPHSLISHVPSIYFFFRIRR